MRGAGWSGRRRVISRFFGSEDSAEVCPGPLHPVSPGIARGPVHLRAQELKPNWGQVVTFSCQRSRPVSMRQAQLLPAAALGLMMII